MTHYKPRVTKNPANRYQWLMWKGGRTENDIIYSPIGEYVRMWDGYKKKNYKLYLPSKFCIK